VRIKSSIGQTHSVELKKNIWALNGGFYHKFMDWLNTLFELKKIKTVFYLGFPYKIMD